MVTAAPPIAAVSADVIAGAQHAARLVARCTDADDLAATLYREWYLGRGTNAAQVAAAAPMVESLAGSFRAAHAGTTRYQPGWTVVDAGGDGTCVVARGDRRRVVRPAMMIAPGGLLPRPGETVAVRRLIDDVPVEGGFWHTFSDRHTLDISAPLSRVYFHATADGAPTVVAAITGLLVEADIAWQLKVLTVPAGYGRADAAVLYVGHGALVELAGELVALHRRLGTALAEPTPPMARRVAGGMAWAAQPPGDDSFGDHRCRLLARAALTCIDSCIDGCIDGRDVLDHFVAELAAAGIDASAPHRPRDREEPPWPSIS